MTKIRKCAEAMLSTGVSKCPLDMKRVIGAILVEPGTVLPAGITKEKLLELCHADRPERIYPIFGFCNFTPNGGEVQTSANGYGPTQASGMSPRSDTFDLAQADEGLHSSLLQCLNKKFDVYYFDEKDFIYGYNAGDGKLHGIPMASVFSNNPLFAGTDNANMSVTFCYMDIRDWFEHYQFEKMDFDASRVCYGLTRVILKEVSSGKYKIIEEIGGYDRTEEFGEAVQAGEGSVVIDGSAVSYDAGLISITSENTPSLAAPSILYLADIKGIEYVGTEKLEA